MQITGVFSGASALSRLFLHVRGQGFSEPFAGSGSGALNTRANLALNYWSTKSG